AVSKASKEFLLKEGRVPSTRELANLLSMTEEAVKLALQIPWSISLDVKKATSKVDHPLYDTVASETPNPEEELLQKEEQRELMSLLHSHEIGPRSAKVIMLYYGLDQREPMTLEKIGAELGITRERVRQIRESTLVKLR